MHVPKKGKAAQGAGGRDHNERTQARGKESMAGPHSAERWSGLETKEMQKIGSTLLFPSDSDFQFELTEFEGTHPLGAQSAIGGRKAFLLVFRAQSTHSKTLEAPCVIAGKCKFTKECLKEFTEISLPKKEQKKLGRDTYSELDWPGVDRVLCCPLCAHQAHVGGTYYLIFYSMMQYLSTSVPHVLGGRPSARLVCLQCMFKMSHGKIPMNTEICGGPTVSVHEYLESSGTTVPVFMRDGSVVDIGELSTAMRLHAEWLFGYVSSVEDAFNQEMKVKATSLLQEMLGPRAKIPDSGTEAGQKAVNKQVEAMRKPGFCWVCNKEGSHKTCSICSKAEYCGKLCQRRDWKRHKVAFMECVPPGVPPRASSKNS